MATGIAQKSCTALFPLWSLRKTNISKMKRKIETQKALNRILIFKYRKNKNKKYTYADYANSYIFYLSVIIDI